MENRLLIIGDELFGESGEVATRAAEMLLCREPSRPMQFSINAPVPLSISQLISRAASDIIGKKAGRIVLGLGLRDLRKEPLQGARIAESYASLVEELVKKTQSGIFLVTIPPDYLPTTEDCVAVINDRLRALEGLYPQRIKVIDLAAQTESFQEKQLERGKFARSLYSEDAKPTSLCITLHSLVLQDCILKEIEE